MNLWDSILIYHIFVLFNQKIKEKVLDLFPDYQKQ